MGRLDGKVALVSGGARGMGASHVRRFVAEGAEVVFGDVLDDLGSALADEVGASAVYRHMDVTAPEDWDAAVADAEERFGRLDVLVNNAGVLQFGVPLHECSLEDFRRVIDINLVGVFLGMRAAIPALLRAGGGSIVNISSTNGLAGYGGTPAYTASKFGVRGMTKDAALTYGKARIRVNSIHPGGIDTVMTRPENVTLTEEEQAAAWAGFPLGRVGQPEEVSNLAVFLASDESSFCTGAEFIVDGGQTAGIVNPAVEVRLPG